MWAHDLCRNLSHTGFRWENLSLKMKMTVHITK